MTDTADTSETTDAPPRSKALGTSLGVAAFVLAITTTVVWFQKVRAVDMPEDTTLFVIAFLTAPVLSLAAFVIGTRWFGGIPAVLGVILGAFLPFTMTVNEQAVAAGAIAVGDRIPAFRSVDEHGQVFDSVELHDHLLLIKFFRAHW